jgi:SAM-dependent methyltransferase
MNGYREDLAWIHHTGFSEFASAASAGVIATLRRHGIANGLVIDVGCGSGVLSRALINAGFDVFGIDASPAMIELAREHAPRARFEVAKFGEAKLPACRAIVAMGEVLNYGTLDEVRTLIGNAANAVEPQGLLLFDVAERGAYAEQEERRIGGDDWSVIVIKDSDGARLTRRILTFRNIDGFARRDEETHVLELYARDELKEILREHGFRVRIRRSYGTRRLPKGHTVYQALKRERRSGGIRGHASLVRPKMR